ncbi:MAG: energy transducer TonB [Blastocatellia bacterium]
MPFAFSTSAITKIPSTRLALIDSSGEGATELARLRERAGQTFTLVPESITSAALSATGYAGSLNMTRDEARALGMSVGCDYYLLLLARAPQRPGADNQPSHEAILALFIIETRSGNLLDFQYARARGADEPAARRELAPHIDTAWEKSATAIARAGDRNRQRSENIPPAMPPDMPVDMIEMSAGDEAATDLAQPVFFQRLRPAYTPEAESLGVTAVVELAVVFGADARVGEIEILRWAGFGLEAAAIETVRQLQFKPATRNGRRVNLRALVRYNFRLPPCDHRQGATKRRRA